MEAILEGGGNHNIILWKHLAEAAKENSNT